jgi:hypothetical protein
MTNAITDSSSEAMDMVEEEQGAMKAVVDEFDKSTDDEARQISAHKALTDLKKIRNKQRKI